MEESHFKPEFPPLLAAGLYPVSLAEAERLLVENFPTSITRLGIFRGLVEILRKLQDEGVDCEVWLDGSFVTKKIDPEDVDLVIRIPAEIYDRNDRRKAVADWATSEDRKRSIIQ